MKWVLVQETTLPRISSWHSWRWIRMFRRLTSQDHSVSPIKHSYEYSYVLDIRKISGSGLWGSSQSIEYKKHMGYGPPTDITRFLVPVSLLMVICRLGFPNQRPLFDSPRARTKRLPPEGVEISVDCWRFEGHPNWSWWNLDLANVW